MKTNEKNIVTAVSEAIAANMELANIKSEHAALVANYNEKRDAGDFKAMAKMDVSMDEKEADYAAKAAILVFRTLRSLGDDMLPAILAFEYPVIKRKDEKVKEETSDGEIEVKVLKQYDKAKAVDLMKYDAYCAKNFGGTVSANARWWEIVEEFNALLTGDVSKNLGVKFNRETYFMSKNSQSNVLGKDGVSNTKILKSLQAIIDAIIFVEGEKGNTFKATSHDVAYIRAVSAKKGKGRLAVKVADHKDMHDTIRRIVYRVVTGGTYAVEHKTAKK